MRGAHGEEGEMGRRMPTMSELRAFEAVARHASFTRAGGDLHLTQSAVSRQVASLEEALGARLLVRSAGDARGGHAADGQCWAGRAAA